MVSLFSLYSYPTSSSCCLEVPPAFKTPPPLCPLVPPPFCFLFSGWLLQRLSLRHRHLSSSQRSAPSCPLTPPLQFATCLPAGCNVTPDTVPPPLVVLLLLCLCLAIGCCIVSTSPPGCLLFTGRLSCCILLCCLHLASPFIAPPSHMFILDPPPSFAPAGCRVASHCAASAPRLLVNTAASQRTTASPCAGNSTSSSPHVCPSWLPPCPGVSRVSEVARILQDPFSDCTNLQCASFEIPRRNTNSHLRQAWCTPGHTGAQPVYARHKI